MLRNYWKHFPHEADIGVRGHGETPVKAMEMASLATTAVVADLEKVQSQVKVHIECVGEDLEILFWNWMNLLIYEMDTRRMLFGSFVMDLKDLNLTVDMYGEEIQKEKHNPSVEVKGATLTALKVQKVNEGWVAQCVLDV